VAAKEDREPVQVRRIRIRGPLPARGGPHQSRAADAGDLPPWGDRAVLRARRVLWVLHQRDAASVRGRRGRPAGQRAGWV